MSRYRLLWIWTLVGFIVLGIAALVRTHYWTYGADTGTFAQLIASTPAGMHDGVENGSHFRFHWSPSLALLWPLVALTHSALGLQLVQAAATVVTAPLLFLLLRPYVEEQTAYRVGIVSLLYPPLIALGFDEFHELGLFPPVAVAMMLTADRMRWWWYALCTLFAIGLREDVSLECIIIGIVLACIGLRPRAKGRGLFELAPARPRQLAIAGAVTTLVAAGTFAFYSDVVVPHFGGWGPQHFYVYSFARGPFNVLAAAVLHPVQFAQAIFTVGRLTYVLEALVPLAFLPLLSWWSLLAVPGALIVLLANSGYVWRMGDHYAALWIPWLLIAAGLGAGKLAQRRGPQMARNWTTAAATLCVIFLVAFDPMHPLHYLRPNYHDLADARRALACVPYDASLSTHDEWYSAVAAQRPYATVEQSDGVAYLVYADDVEDERFRTTIYPAVQAEVRDGRYKAICHYGNVTAYERTNRS